MSASCVVSGLIRATGVGVALLAVGSALGAGEPPQVARHVAAAKAAAGTQWEGLFNTLCAAPAPSAAPGTPSAPPAGVPPMHYVGSAERFAQIAAQAKADVLLSNHTVFDGSKLELPRVSSRSAEQPNPYVIGAASVRDYLAVAGECARAGLARLPR